jgi:hypothetical protein
MEDNIFVLPNVVSEELFKEVIEYFENNKELQKQRSYKWGNNVVCDAIFANDHKQTHQCTSGIDAKIFQALTAVIKDNLFYKLPKAWTYSTDSTLQDSGYEIRKIKGSTRFHADDIDPKVISSDSVRFRVGTIILCLSNSLDTLDFPMQNRKVKLVQGTLIFFPPYWTHPHQTTYGGCESYRIQTWLTVSKRNKRNTESHIIQ